MPSKTVLALCAGLPMALSSAATALPPILDRVPQDALVVITTPSIEKIDRDVQALSAAAKLPIPAMMGVQQMMAMQGLDQVIDSTRPAAVFIRGWTDVEEEPPFVALVPVKDYQGMVGMFMAEEQAGLHQMQFGGQTMYSRPVEGGYAAIGTQAEQVRAYNGGAGNAAAHKTLLGAAGEKVLDESDLGLVINAQNARGLIEQLGQVMQEQVAMNMGMGMELPDSPVATWLKETITRDAQAYVSGVSVGAKGATVDVVLRFTPGSYMGKVVGGGGDASATFARLPKQPYLFAFATDMSTAGVRTFIKDLVAKAKEGGDAMPNMALSQIDKIKGQSFMMGGPVALMVPGGLFASTVSYVATDDPAGYIRGVKETLTSMEGMAIEGLTYDTEWQDNATTVGGVSAHAWTIRMGGDGTNPAAMQVQMLFGPAGLNGYIAPAAGGVVQTYSKNSMLLTAALETAKGGQPGLGTDDLTKRVGQSLPAGRVLEGYLGLQSVMQMAAPFIAMQTGVQPKLPGELPPVGFAVSAGEGNAQARLFIPSPVIEAAASIGMSLQRPQDFDEDEMGESGQPGF